MKYKFTRINSTLWVAVMRSFAPRRYAPKMVFVYGDKKKDQAKFDETFIKNNIENKGF